MPEVQLLSVLGAWPPLVNCCMQRQQEKFHTSGSQLSLHNWGNSTFICSCCVLQVLLYPGRIFIREGLLWKVCRKGPKKRQFFLFNDILVCDLGRTSAVVISYFCRCMAQLWPIAIVTSIFYPWPKCQSVLNVTTSLVWMLPLMKTLNRRNQVCTVSPGVRLRPRFALLKKKCSSIVI